MAKKFNSSLSLPVRFYLTIVLAFPLFHSTNAQQTYFGDEPVVWTSYLPVAEPPELKNYSNSDLVVIHEKTEFYFYSTNNQKIIKNVLFKVNTTAGLSMLQSFKLPESFDYAYDNCLNNQGRRSRIDIPYISEYRIDRFAVRRQVKKSWKEMSFNYKVDKIRWVRGSGEFVNDGINVFQLNNLAVGDIVEIYYEAYFATNYGSNLFYFNGNIPKLNSEYNFIYKVSPRFADYSFILPRQIKDSLVKKSVEEFKDYSVVNYKIKLNNLLNINYPLNSFEGNSLPHVFADFRYYTIMKGSYPSGGIRVYEYDNFRPKNFEWLIYRDTSNNFTKIYDNQFASIRKFISTMPVINSDSTKLSFLKGLCDTLNSYKYINANDLFYNKSELYNLYSGDHLLKRRITQHTIWKLTQDILNEEKIFYYYVNIEDNRFSEHDLKQRYHYAYENYLIAVPCGKTYIYFLPRRNGVKYHLNELPFYYEGVIASMRAQNFQENIKDKENQIFKFMKTHGSDCKVNTRVESATFKIALDSLKASVSIKEIVSGQFSTVLRHCYLNEYIDSTISINYFRKCTDKPLTKEAKIKLTSHITESPYRYNFACTEKMSLPSSKYLDMTNWFSFLLSKKVINETPNFDYYFDFEYTDSYNFLLDLNKNVEFVNGEGLNRKIENDYFFLESSIIKNSESTYLIKVNYSVKQRKIPLNQMNLLFEMIKTLDELNSYKLKIKE